MKENTNKRRKEETQKSSLVKKNTESQFVKEMKELGKSDKKQIWTRTVFEKEKFQEKNLIFQQLTIDYTLSSVFPESFSPTSEASPIIKIFGITMDGHSVLCKVYGFLPYFYIEAPSNINSNDSHYFQTLFNDLLVETTSKLKGIVVQVEVCLKKSIFGFDKEKSRLFLKVTLNDPKHITALRKHIENGINYGSRFGTLALQVYEANIEFILRFMIDKQIVGCSWIELPSPHYSFSTCTSKANVQIEVDVFHDKLIAHAAEVPLFFPPNPFHFFKDEWLKLSPLRILSFDIECIGRKGHFPEAKLDPVIQIANVVSVLGDDKPFVRNIFTLGTCAHIVGSEVFEFNNERDLLMNWKEFMILCDPDIIIGYNISNFDFPYLIERAHILGLSDFSFLGRTNSQCTVKDTTFSNRMYGKRENKVTTIDGRVQFDVYQYLQREFKLSSYTLNAVASHFLGEQKEDVHYSIIETLQNGDSETRRRLAVYCLKDAYLPLRIINKLMGLYNHIEMARVTGVPLDYLLSRGQQIKVISQLMRKAKSKNHLIPTYNVTGGEDAYEGATVIEPCSGYYDCPIATLDFSSLYPSIMIAHNLCYSTLLKNGKHRELREDEYTRTPSGHCFVKANLCKGLLPEILEDLLSARKRVKNALKEEKNSFFRAVLDGRQLALKISANSVYGFTGATIGKLPCLEISSSVTAFGREMIDKTKLEVERTYTIENGYAFNAKVIYGDTDSVMIKFGDQDIATTMSIGKKAATDISSIFINPIKLEFEKVYFPFLLISKKRYAGLYWTNEENYDKMDCKGIETVRRDNCLLVKNVINTCLNKILIERNIEGAQQFCKDTIADLLQNRIDISQLVITKALSKTESEYSGKQAHVVLAEKMKMRNPANAPSLGDRIPYVIIKAKKGAAAYDKSEDPIYVLENNIPIDTTYYLHNQLANPLTRLFEPIIGKTKTNLLLEGDHTRTISIATPVKGGLMKFTKKIETCIGCKTRVQEGVAVCEHCESIKARLYLNELSELNLMQYKFSKLWTECQRCQGSFYNEVICTSRDCPIFYMRKKVQKDTTEQTKVVERF